MLEQMALTYLIGLSGMTLQGRAGASVNAATFSR